MPVIFGNTSTSATSTAYGTAVTINSLSVTNKSGSSVEINISILYGSTNTWISPYNLTLNAGEIYEDDKPILLLPNHIIYISVTGNCDYYFSIKSNANS